MLEAVAAMSQSTSTKRQKHRKLESTRIQERKMCRVTRQHKVCYTSRKEALTILNMKRAEGSEAKSIYKCRHCGKWHMTKQEVPDA